MEDDIKWHPGFFEAVQFELCDYPGVFDFIFEHPLAKEPLRIDVLIIRKVKDVIVKKNFARIFRAVNVVEYKSPDDYLSVSDFKKVQGYAWIYASQTGTDINEMTVTYVVRRYPEKVFEMLAAKKRYTVKKVENGIYHVKGGDIIAQIIVEKELDPDENFWLTSLRNELLPQDELLTLFRKLSRLQRQEDKAFVNIIARINRKTIEGESMETYFEQAMRDLGFANKFIIEGEARGREEGEEWGKEWGERHKAQQAVLRVLEARFKSAPANIKESVESYTDLIALDSLLQHAAVCASVQEFQDALVR